MTVVPEPHTAPARSEVEGNPEPLSWPGGAPAAWAARFFALAYAVNYFSIRTADPDFWGHLAIGRLMWTTRSIPHHDVFSYLPTRDWLNYEWLANVVYYPIYRMTGEPGILLFKIAMGVATMLVAYCAARRRAGTDFPVILVLIPAIAAVALGFAPRAQVFTYLLFACWLYCLERARGGDPRWLLALPVSMLAWANLHAGFLAGLGVLGLYVAGEAMARRPWRPFLMALGASVVVACINPYGLKYWTILLEGTTIKRRHITEWLPVPFDLATQPFFKVLVLLTILFIIIGRAWREPSPLFVLIVTGALAWKAQRHLPLFGLAAAVYVPALIAQSLRGAHDDRSPLPRALTNTLAVMLWLAAALMLYNAAGPDGRFTFALDRTQYPEGAIRFMRDNQLRGNLAVEFRWALFAAWKLSPEVKVSVDGRYETVFDPALINEDLDFFYGKEPHRFLEKYPPDFVLTETRPLRRFLDVYPRAKLMYADKQSWLYRIEK